MKESDKKLTVLLEHSAVPGTYYNDCLIYGDTGTLNEMVSLNEAADPAIKMVKFRGKLQEAEAVNKNKRMYPLEVLQSNVKNLTELLENGGLCGELDHPTDSIVHFKEASHKFTKLWWEGKVLMGEGFILNTPCGKILRSLLSDGVRIGMSSRGVGNGRVNENGILVIGEGYKLITFDAVADPSTHAAYQRRVLGNNTEESTRNNSETTSKNETTSIHTVNKDLLIACCQATIKSNLEKIKKEVING